MIEKYFKELLYKSDCVVIPGLGGFLCSYAGAELSASKNKISPPHKKIVFNEKISTDDNVLKQFIGQFENKTSQDIEREIIEYVKVIKESLATKQQVTIEQLGRLYIGSDNNILFEQFTKFNYLIESYGLPDLYFKPIDRTKDIKQLFKPKKNNHMASNYSNQYEDDEEDEMENRYNDDESEEIDVEEFARQKKQKKTENLALYYVMAIVALMLTAGTAYYLNMDKETYAVGSFNPFGFLKTDKTTDSTKGDNLDNKLLPNSDGAEAPADNQAETTETESSAANQESTANDDSSEQAYEISSQTGRFFIIAGGFKNKRKATALRKKLEQDGQQAKVIQPYDDNSVYRVSLGDYETYDEAKNQKEHLAGTYGEELWVLNY